MLKKERRRFVRIKKQCPVSYCILPQTKVRRKMSLDLSQAGLRFIAEDFIPLNSKLKMEIDLDNPPRLINVIAQPVWIKGIFADEYFNVGVRFLEISKEDLRYLSWINKT
ncbi:MAG: PilZ domain-containing protein [Candidatus Omnitrophica bacterium]|nr:PilZ domain-containing protein [Candidatus Omnitrophota bacterium]